MSDMIKDREIQIKKLQQNLFSIRKIAGWTAEVLGEKIGVTKQTISNIENHKTPLNFTQYIAIRSVLDYEIENNKDNEVLPKIVKLLLDSDNELDSDDYTKVQEVIETVAATASGGISDAKLSQIFNALILPLPFAIPIFGAIIFGSKSWMKRLFK